MSVAWAHGFESAKKSIKKVYPKVDLSLYYLSKFLEVATEHEGYDYSLDIEKSKDPSIVVPQTFFNGRKAIELPSTSEV